MKEIIILGALSSISFIIFIGLLIVGIVQKKQKFTFLSFLFLFTAIALGVFTAYKIIYKTHSKITTYLKPRSGEEIYLALFGASTFDCVEVLDYQDQIVPKIDAAIWLHFKTCPEECKRLLSEYNYDMEIVTTSEWNSSASLSDNITWWKPQTLDDTIYVFEYPIIEGKNIRTLWIAKDSSEVYCRDILD